MVLKVVPRFPSCPFRELVRCSASHKFWSREKFLDYTVHFYFLWHCQHLRGLVDSPRRKQHNCKVKTIPLFKDSYNSEWLKTCKKKNKRCEIIISNFYVFCITPEPDNFKFLCLCITPEPGNKASGTLFSKETFKYWLCSIDFRTYTCTNECNSAVHKLWHEISVYEKQL